MENIQQIDPAEAFQQLGGTGDHWPRFISMPEKTASGERYFKTPGVALIARTEANVHALRPFLDGFNPGLGFVDYADDKPIGTGDEDGATLVKAAGQLCYLSFGPQRSKNADAQKYIDNILKSGHGSVLEHAQYTFLIWGVGRDFTHELVRHRSGCAFSQVSQRYVDGLTLRFVERPEYQSDPELHGRFEERITRTAADYNEVAEKLLARQLAGDPSLVGDKKAEARKKVNQAARSLLPNETEAPIVFSGNVRALRHVIEMRAASPADVPIRLVTTRIFLCMRAIEPTLFNDYKLYQLNDGTHVVTTEWRKV